jgi:hypothetical protein
LLYPRVISISIQVPSAFPLQSSCQLLAYFWKRSQASSPSYSNLYLLLRLFNPISIHFLSIQLPLSYIITMIL